MYSFITLLLSGLAAALLLQLGSHIHTSIRQSRKARELGCEPAFKPPGSGFLGLSYIREILAADKEYNLPDFLVERWRNYCRVLGTPIGTYRYSLLGRETLQTVDPENIKAMLATQFEDFEQGPLKRAILLPIVGDGIFSQDGKKWEHSRALLRPNFVRDQIGDLARLEVHVQNLLRVVDRSLGEPKNAVDLKPLFFRLTLDSASELLFGESVDSQLKSSKDFDEDFPKAFDNAQHHAAIRGRMGHFYWLHNPKEMHDSAKAMQSIVDGYVKAAMNSSSKSKDHQSAESAKYIFAEELARQTQDPVEIRSQLLNILLAGRDTTASLLCYVFHHLARRPDIFAKLRRNVLDDFGDYHAPRDLTFASLKSCLYLQHVLNESLRRDNVVPLNFRTATRDTTLPRGGGADASKPVFVRKGQTVEFSMLIVHRRKDIWGEDADEFKPERWQGRKPGWEFTPFSGGPRICIGQQLAIISASYVIVRLLQRFEKIEGTAEELNGPVLHNVSITSCPYKGPIVTVEKAAS